jgi:hypothetical protein
MMTDEEAIAALNAIGVDDPERAHMEADSILLSSVSLPVSEAYQLAMNRQRWVASA